MKCICRRLINEKILEKDWNNFPQRNLKINSMMEFFLKNPQLKQF